MSYLLAQKRGTRIRVSSRVVVYDLRGDSFGFG
jgi:hypothetical protein